MNKTILRRSGCLRLTCSETTLGQSRQLRFALVMIAILLSFCSNAHAQYGLGKQRLSKAQWSRGFHGFKMIAEGNGLELISLREFYKTPSQDVMVIALGRLDRLGKLGRRQLNVTNHVVRGGSALVASDSSRPVNDKVFAGFVFGKFSSYPEIGDFDSLHGMHDCPVVSDFGSHPIVSNVFELATNRPGYIQTRKTILANLPSDFREAPFREAPFIGVSENPNEGRAIAVGDQSIFTNQMILYGDNMLFANQAVSWLKNDRCSKLLILVNGREYSSSDLTDVVVHVPPPSREDVMDALQDIPPSAMLDFANSVATVVEDENMVNDFIHDSVDKVPESVMNRFYIYLLFGIACLSFIVAFLFQSKLQRQTASDVAFKRSRGQQVDLKTIQFHERQRAAHFLLDKFCFDMAEKQFGDWPNFPSGLLAVDDGDSKEIFESMTKMSVLYRSKPTTFWTRKKLAFLDKEVGHWRSYFESRPILATVEEA